MTIVLKGDNRSGATIKAKRAPPEINTAKEALEAFQRLNTYRSMESGARADARRYTSGTPTFNRHHDRADLYCEVADEWEAVLGRWLRKLADKESNKVAQIVGDRGAQI